MPNDQTVLDRVPQHPAGGILTHGYDGVGNRILLHSWLGRQTMAYDAANRCTVMEDTDSRRTTWSFDARALMTRLDNWNGTRTTAAYDGRGLTQGIRHSKSDNTLLGENQYQWNAAGQPTRRVTGGGTTTWVYDSASQLTAEWHEVGLISSWVYDGAGNRLSQDRLHGGVRTLTGYAYDRANQIVTLTEGAATTTFSFDGSGNMRSEEAMSGSRTTYSWDPQDRLLLVEPQGAMPATYAYRYDGLLATANQGEGLLDQIWDVPGATGYGDLLEEIDAGDALKRAYYRATQLSTQKEAGSVYAAAQDHLGSVQLFTDAAQAVAGSFRYGAWGEALTATGAATGPLGWLGEWGYYRGSSRRAWVRARHLDVRMGRWLSPDPASLPELGDYVLVDNAPVSFVDPTGLVAVQFGRFKVGSGDPFLIFTDRGLAEGLDTGVAAALSALSDAVSWIPSLEPLRYEGGACRNAPGFGVSKGISSFGQMLLLTGPVVVRGVGRVFFVISRRIGTAQAHWRRGRQIERLLGAQRRLRHNFEGIDVFTGTGTAISIKSIDPALRSYQSVPRFAREVRKLVRALRDFQGAEQGTTRVRPQDIRNRVLMLGLPRDATSRVHRAALNEIRVWARQQGVTLRVEWF
jgi:RHS repeat-associated protein